MTLRTKKKTAMNLEIAKPESNNDYEAMFFINGDLSTGDYKVHCPTGIKLTRKHLASRPKLIELLDKGDIEVLKNFKFSAVVKSGSSYQNIKFQEQMKDIDDPILLGLLRSQTDTSDEEYFQMVKVYLHMETKHGTKIECFAPSFDVPQVRVNQGVIAQQAIIHHELVDKEVTFTPTSISSATKREEVLEEEDY